MRMELLVVVLLMMQSQRTTSEIVGAQWGTTKYILMLNIRLSSRTMWHARKTAQSWLG